MISLLLFYKIFQLFIFMVLGFIIVKAGVVKSEDSSALSKISLYLLMPAVIINSFDIKITPDIINGLILAFIGAIAIHIVFLFVDTLFKKIFKSTSVERASVMYPNSANLIIPIVSYVLGDEWVIYTCAFLTVQLFFMWTHGIQLFSDDKKINIRKIILNPNIIAIVIGALFMIFGIRLPKVMKDTVSSLGSMVGTVGMLIAGMLASKVDFKKMLANKRLYLILIMRMIICPFILLFLIKFAFMGINVINAEKILLISFLASITPSAATVMQFAQIHNKDADYATAINIATTVFCVASMPFFVWLFNLIII